VQSVHVCLVHLRLLHRIVNSPSAHHLHHHGQHRHLMAVGGTKNSSTNCLVETFNLDGGATASWKPALGIIPFGACRTGFTVTSSGSSDSDSKFVYVGGVDVSGNPAPNVWQFENIDFVAGSSTPVLLSPLAPAAGTPAGHASAVVNGTLVVLGGSVVPPPPQVRTTYSHADPNPHKQNRNIKHKTMPTTSHHCIASDIDVTTILTAHHLPPLHRQRHRRHHHPHHTFPMCSLRRVPRTRGKAANSYLALSACRLLVVSCFQSPHVMHTMHKQTISRTHARMHMHSTLLRTGSRPFQRRETS
jgi:hypothetical protein